MSDSESKSAIPAWQRDSNNKAEPTLADDGDQVSEPGASGPSQDQTSTDLDVARRFLEDDQVRSASLDKKREFLQSKGIQEADIQTLLAESSTTAQTVDARQPETPSSNASATQAETSSTPTQPSVLPVDRPPIVTYPEFLTKPVRPPPLVTQSALLTAGSMLAGLAALVHGTSRYVLSPMLETQTEAREDFHQTAASRLSALVSKLEDTVTTLPAGKDVETESDAGDPTEMFHRDMGTQTTPIDTARSLSQGSGAPSPSPVQTQADGLNKLNRNLAAIKEGLKSQSNDSDDIKTLIDVFRDDLDAMVYGGQAGHYDVGSTGGSYGLVGRNKEPDDEIKKVKDSVRRVKGALLSTRSFPSSTVH